MKRFTIRRLGHQGDGIADGPIYAPKTLPDEVVTGQSDGDRLTEIKIETPSPDRVKPPCSHFNSCGGCLLQHASDAFLAHWKVDVARAALNAKGIDAAFLPIAISPPHSRRRATFSARRTKKGAMVGFHGKGSDVVVEIPNCQILHPDLVAAAPACEALAQIGASRKHGLDVAVTLSRNGLDVAVSSGKPLDGRLRISLAATAEQHQLARLTWNDETIVTLNSPKQQFGTVEVVPPPAAFLQATVEGQQALVSDVVDITAEAKRIVDLFAGCGTFGLPLAQYAEVHAIEGSAAMIEALDTGWRGAEGLKPVTHEARDIFRRPLMPDELARFDAAVIDPPRVGAEAQIEELCQAKTPVIAYVSCNPVSFARDAKRLIEAGYALDRIRVVDQFRWSVHIELVAGFSFTSR